MAAMTETCIAVRGTACKITCATQEREREKDGPVGFVVVVQSTEAIRYRNSTFAVRYDIYTGNSHQLMFLSTKTKTKPLLSWKKDTTRSGLRNAGFLRVTRQ